MKFKYGKSYLYLGLGFAAFWIVLILIEQDFDTIRLFLPLFPIFLLFLWVSQLRSRIALNSCWVAKYPAGTWEYSFMLALNGFVVILSSVIVVLSIAMP